MTPLSVPQKLVVWLWLIVGWLTAAGYLAMVVIAAYLYRVKHTRSFALLMWACICLLIAHSSQVVFFIVGNILFAYHNRSALPLVYAWEASTESTFLLLFVALMIIALLSFLGARNSAAASASNQSLQPTAGRSGD